MQGLTTLVFPASCLLPLLSAFLQRLQAAAAAAAIDQSLAENALNRADGVMVAAFIRGVENYLGGGRW